MKVKKGKKILIIIGLLLVIILSVIGYLVVSDLKQEAILKQEIVNITNKDLITDNYQIEVKTTGDYAYIEEAIKTYFKKISDSSKLIDNTFNNEKLIEILSVENFQKDGPNFEESYKTLNTAREDLNNAIKTIIDLCNEEAIKNLIDKDKVEDYYYDLYLELMYNENDLKEMDDIKNKMVDTNNEINSFLDKVEDFLNFLKQNSGKWHIEAGQLYFDNNYLVDQYNNYYYAIQNS